MSASRIHLSAAVVAGLILATAAGISVNIIATSAATAQELQPMSLELGNRDAVSTLTTSGPTRRILHSSTSGLTVCFQVLA